MKVREIIMLLCVPIQSGGIERSKLNGLFNSQAELDSCETMWHNLYKHTVAEYRDNVSGYGQV